MLFLLQEGQYVVFALLAFALIASLTFHEYGHAFVAKRFGDNTAELAGRLTLNPMAHIDPMGFLMVVFVGFGYAKPVPTDRRNFTHASADLWVSAAGPLMNLLLAIVTWNFFLLMHGAGIGFFRSPVTETFFVLLAQVNLLLMAFNLIPIAPLDGHYILPYLLPRSMRRPVMMLNQRYGPFVLLGVIALSLLGFPVLSFVFGVGQAILPMISWLG